MSGALETLGSHAETVTIAQGRSRSSHGPSEFPFEFGGYRLLGLLGRGGMGTVYEAQQLSTGRRVALKMLGQQLDSAELRQRFLREGRLAAGVNHPNSLYIFGSEEIEDLPVITMEIAGAGTLKDKLKERGPLPVTEAVDDILDVISGLEAAFAGGVLHRDIKPSNCFVSPDGSVKVGDFGLSVSTLAKTDTFITAHGKIMGTPAYASPEQLRGDNLDVRTDIYSVGATLFTLLTDRAPFEGDNAVQVVANAVNQKPKALSEFREDIPPGLEKIVARCLAKTPDGRYDDYKALRNALLPFSSKEPEPASMLLRASAGWIDYLIAFLPPYIALMFIIGSDKLIVQPLVQHTLYSFRYYFLFLGFGFLYFTLAEGFFGAGLGKHLKGLRVVRTNGRTPGIVRALLRILIPIACVECIRMPLMMTFISDAQWTGFQTALYVVGTIVCCWIPGLLGLTARRENGFATVWDLASGTRVQVKLKGTLRPTIETEVEKEIPAEGANFIGPYQVIKELVPGEWAVATDPVLRRQIWLIRRTTTELSLARRNVARSGRLRWLQKVEKDQETWDAFEATKGMPFSSLIEEGKHLPWTDLRHWLHDLASEIWEASADKTLSTELSLDFIWITTQGRAILLDWPCPDVKIPAECIAVGDLAGQQKFLNSVAACAESTSLPLHARGVLDNLADGKFEKLSFLTGILRGLLDKPSKVSKGIRAGSIFMLPLYVWIAVFVGRYHDKPLNDPATIVLISALAVLGTIALIQLFELPFGSTASQFLFRLAVINAKGKRSGISKLFFRWAVIWLPLFIPILFAVLLIKIDYPNPAFIIAVVTLGLWLCAAIYSVISPNRGLHDRIVGTWVVRQ
jgi:uncharacterized RDD family membrane protein YckC